MGGGGLITIVRLMLQVYSTNKFKEKKVKQSNKLKINSEMNID